MDKISISNLTKIKFKKEFFQNIFKIAKSIAKENRKCDLSIVLADKVLSQKLNQTYKQKNSPANVLTFVYDSDKNYIGGEIVICPEVIKLDEISYYFTHALLHFFGFKHHKLKDYLKMEKLEKKVILALKKKNFKV